MAPMPGLFISYRRDDAEGQAGRLYNDLEQAFGSEQVFMDVAAIQPGADFRRVLDERMASCSVLLAVIGKQWADIRDPAGARRLHSANDFVRLEVAAALRRNIPVVPVLVQKATMPQAAELPPDLEPLAYRQAFELTHAKWESDVAALVQGLRPLLGNPVVAAPAEPAAASAHKKPLWAALAGLLVGAAAVVAWLVVKPGGAELQEAEERARIARAQLQAAEDELRTLQLKAQQAQLQAQAASAAAAAAAAKVQQAATEPERNAAQAAAASKAEEWRVARQQADTVQATLAQKQRQTVALADEINRNVAVVAAARPAQPGPDAATRAVAPTPPVATKPQATPAGRTLVLPNMKLFATPCGAAQRVAVVGTARVVVAPRTDGGVRVSVFVQAEGDGYRVQASGEQRADAPQPNYSVPVRGQWQGPQPISTESLVRVVMAPDGGVSQLTVLGSRSVCK